MRPRWVDQVCLLYDCEHEILKETNSCIGHWHVPNQAASRDLVRKPPSQKTNRPCQSFDRTRSGEAAGVGGMYYNSKYRTSAAGSTVHCPCK